MTKKIILFIPILLLCVSCNFIERKQQQEQKIAEINGKALLLSDVKDIFPTGISPEDSLQLLQSYVNNWARKQLMADLAEQYLTKEQKDVSQEIEDYRLSLLIFRYEKLYLEQRLNASVSEAAIIKLYRESPQNFILTKPIAKAVFTKISKDVPQVKRIRRIYLSSKENEQQEMAQIGFSVAEKYTGFDDQWVDAEMLSNELPLDIRQIETEWQKGSITTQTDEHEYFVRLYDIMQAGTLAPIEYVHETISDIIRNRRKQELLKELENSVFNNALDHNKLKIYIDK